MFPRPWNPADPSIPTPHIPNYIKRPRTLFFLPHSLLDWDWITDQFGAKLQIRIFIPVHWKSSRIPQNLCGGEEPQHRTDIMSCHLPWILSLRITLDPALHVPESFPANRRLLHHWLEIKLSTNPIPFPPFPAVSLLSIIRHQLPIHPDLVSHISPSKLQVKPRPWELILVRQCLDEPFPYWLLFAGSEWKFMLPWDAHIDLSFIPGQYSLPVSINLQTDWSRSQ